MLQTSSNQPAPFDPPANHALPSFGRRPLMSDMPALINFMSACRREPSKWAFFHVALKEGSNVNLDEVIQMIEQRLAENNPIILNLDDQILVLCATPSSKPFNLTENEIDQDLRTQQVTIDHDVLYDRGIGVLEKILSDIVPEEDRAGRLALRRFARLSNVFMVLDDDPVVLRQMEHMLKSYGHVECFSTVKDFLPAYSRYAPNTAFVDIHLQGDRGTNVASMITEKMDPGAHVIMISADAIKPNVIESMGKGAKSFIGKPVKMDMVLRSVITTPTMYAKR